MCNYCALKGQMYAFIVLQYVTVLQHKELHHIAANSNTPEVSNWLLTPLKETENVSKCQTLHLVT